MLFRAGLHEGVSACAPQNCQKLGVEIKIRVLPQAVQRLQMLPRQLH